MNNKILIGIVGVLVIVGVVLVILITKGNTTQQQAVQQPIQPQTPIGKEKQVNVIVKKDGFDPATITIDRGSRVIWINRSGAKASVNSADHPDHKVYRPLNLGLFDDSLSVQLVFDTVGTYQYHNHLIPTQTGTVIVK